MNRMDPTLKHAPESPLEALFEAAGDLALHLGSDGAVTHACGLERLPGLAPLTSNGQSFFALFTAQSQVTAREAFATAIGSGQRIGMDAALHLDSAPPLHWMLSGYNTGGRRGVMAVANQRAAPQDPDGTGGLQDALTGLPNRLLLKDRCAHAIVLGKRKGTGFALLLLNLRGFRKVNDAFGVGIGDELLRQVAQRLTSHLRSSDTVARIGPDEFALLLPDMADAEGMLKFGRKLLALLEAPFLLEGSEIHMSASMGFAIYPVHGGSHEDLLQGATAAMNDAQQAGGARCAMFGGTAQAEARAGLSLESALHQGVADGELYLDYQPLVDIAGRIYGAEALMRWRRGGTVSVSPTEFIPVAEDCGLIHILGAWALKAATTGVALLNRDQGTTLTISVNVSPRQFRGPRFLQSVTEALAFSGLAPALLQLEITEGTLMTDPESAAMLLARLTTLGVQVAVDDFGTGYSSLAYLKRFSLSALKIDRSFVKDLPAAIDLAICRSVFSLSRELGLKSVAEGVETQEQWFILRDVGCDAIQGYFFGKPQALAEFGALVSASGGGPVQRALRPAA
jgi:diguanylate cyclase (GGDEF)-like protein